MMLLNGSCDADATNSARSDAPSTISGVAIGMKIARLVLARPRNWYRTRARAISVPRAVAAIVAISATTMEVASASDRPGRLSGDIHASRENSAQTKLNLPSGLLNENRIMTAIGIMR